MALMRPPGKVDARWSASSYLAGEPHTDHPRCVSPVVRAFCTTLNDGLEDRPRKLRPYLERTIGTAEDGLDEARSWVAPDWLVRTYAPTWLAAAGLNEAAQRLATLPVVVDGSDLQAALVALGLARREARASWSAALGAARAASWVSWSAGRAAAREAAWTSAVALARAAARVAVREIAADRARAAAREISGDAAATLVREARTKGGRDTAGAALAQRSTNCSARRLPCLIACCRRWRWRFPR